MKENLATRFDVCIPRRAFVFQDQHDQWILLVLPSTTALQFLFLVELVDTRTENASKG